MRKKNNGFTLIELIVVLLLMGIISSVALLTLPQSDLDKQAEKQAKRLYELIKVASDSATLTNRQYGIRFNNKGYDFYQLADNKKWLKVQRHRFLKSHLYPIELDMQLSINDIEVAVDDSESLKAQLENKKALKPQIMMLSDGEIVPDFEIILSNPKTATEFIIAPGDLELLNYEKKTLDDF